jgi:lysophospholipase L1-like esterase
MLQFVRITFIVALAFSLGLGAAYARYKTPATNNKAYRSQVIQEQTRQLVWPGTLVMGDSLIEHQLINDLCGPALNAGIGSATSADLLALSNTLLPASPARLVIVAGANDVLQHGAPQQLQRNVEGILLNFKHAEAIVFGVPGSGAADDALRRAANVYGASFVPWPITDLTETVDGLHLNARGAARWQATAKAALSCG